MIYISAYGRKFKLSFEIRNNILRRWLPESGESVAKIPPFVEVIGQGAFKDSSVLEEVLIPKSVHTIGSNAFNGCHSLKKVVLNEGLKQIEDSAFEDCPLICVLDIPDSVFSVGNNAFKGTPWLEDRSEDIVISNGILISSYKTLESAVIPEGVRSIAACAFFGCEGLKKISFPKTLSF